MYKFTVTVSTIVILYSKFNFKLYGYTWHKTTESCIYVLKQLWNKEKKLNEIKGLTVTFIAYTNTFPDGKLCEIIILFLKII